MAVSDPAYGDFDRPGVRSLERRSRFVEPTRTTRSTIGDDRRVFSDEEFALILRKAAELARPADASSHSAGGLTLAEMKAAAAQAGIEPELVERAARLLTANATAAPSFLERLFGGRARYSSETDVPLVLDEVSLAQLMSAIRISVGRPGEGHSSALGLTWRSSEDGGAILSITAQVHQGSTTVTGELDRRSTLIRFASLTGAGCFMAFLLGGTLASELASGFEFAGALLGVAGVLAVARRNWRSSTRRARDRLSRVMDSVGRFLMGSGSVTSGGQRAAPAGTENDPVDDAS